MTAGKVRLITILIVLGAVLITCLSGIYVVNPGEQAVVLTFGKITDVKESGTYWRLPMAQQVRIQSTTRLYTFEYGFETVTPSTPASPAVYRDVPDEATMLTKDQNIVNVEVVYQIKVTDVESYLYRVDDPEETMQHAFEAVLRRNLQSLSLDDALLAKEQIAKSVLEDFQAMLKPYNMGVAVTAVMIQNINVPDQASAAYADVINATTEKTKNKDEATKYRNQVLPDADAKAYKLEQDAEAYKASIIANALGEVALFNEVYAKYVDSKEITRKRLLIETLESILTNADKLYIVNEDGGLMKLLNLDGGALPAGSAQTGGN